MIPLVKLWLKPLQSLTDFGMDIRDCVGQTHDGAANMSGIKNVLLLILREWHQQRVTIIVLVIDLTLQ